MPLLGAIRQSYADFPDRPQVVGQPDTTISAGTSNITPDLPRANIIVPNIYQMPVSGMTLQNVGAAINAEITLTIESGRNHLYLSEGYGQAETSIVIPPGFSLSGMGKVDTANPTFTGAPSYQLAWGGGTKIYQPNLLKLDVVRMCGTANIGNTQSSGRDYMTRDAALMNISLIGQMNNVGAVSGPVNASFSGLFTMASGSNELVSQGGAVFSTGSLQAIVTVSGAGAGGVALVGIVEAVNSPTVVTLSAIATTAVSVSSIGYQPALFQVEGAPAGYVQGGPGTLLVISNASQPVVENIALLGAFTRHLGLRNVWDFRLCDIISYDGGFRDATVTADSAAVRGYTGRMFLPSETAYGTSWGVPAIEIVSPNATGPDNINNGHFRGMRVESSICDNVGVLASGGNAVAITFTDAKIELTEGASPNIVLDGQAGVTYHGWLFGAGTGTAQYSSIGNFPQSAPFCRYVHRGLVVAYNSIGLTFTECEGGFPGATSNAAVVEAFFNFKNCSAMEVGFCVASGPPQLTQTITKSTALTTSTTSTTVQFGDALVAIGAHEGAAISLPGASTRGALNSTIVSVTDEKTVVIADQPTVALAAVSTAVTITPVADNLGSFIRLDGCERPGRLSTSMTDYVRTLPRSVLTEVKTVNGCTDLGAPSVPRTRMFQGTADRLSFDDRGGTAIYNGSSPVTVTVPDLGPGVPWTAFQWTSAATVTLVADTGVTFMPPGAPLSTSGAGTGLWVLCGGDGNVAVFRT